MDFLTLLAAGAIKGTLKAKRQIRQEEREDLIRREEQTLEDTRILEERAYESRVKELEELEELRDKENEAMRRAFPGTQNDSLVISQMLRDSNNTNYWSVDRLTGTDEGTKAQQVSSFLTTPSPIRNSSGSFLADTYNLERQSPNNQQFRRSRENFYNAFTLALKDYVGSAQEKVPTLLLESPDAQAKLRENIKLKNITPNLQPLLNQVLGQIGDAEDKQDFIKQINKSFKTAYGIELVDKNGAPKVYKPIFPKDFNEAANMDEIEVVPEGPKVTLPSNNRLYNPEEVNNKIDYLFQNPYKDAAVTRQLDAKGDPITGSSDHDSILGIKLETHHDLTIIEDLIKENKLESRKGVVYLTSGTFKDKQRYEYALNNLARNYGVIGTTELLDEILPSSFGNTFGVEEQLINESDAEFEARTSGVVDTRTIEFYQTRNDNIRLTQTSLEDAIQLLRKGKALTGASAAVFTRLVGLFGAGGQAEQLSEMFNAFSGVGEITDTGQTSYTRGDNADKQQESIAALTEGRDKYNNFMSRVLSAQKGKRGELLAEMYSDTLILRYLQTEIVYNIARTLENPDGSGARLSRTDIDQMIQGTRLGALLSNRDGMIAMLGYLQTRNNANYQEAKYFSEPTNYNDGSKRIAFNMVKSATRFDENSLNEGRLLSDSSEQAIGELQNLISRAVLEGKAEAKEKEGVELILEQPKKRAFDEQAFDAVKDLIETLGDDDEVEAPTPSARQNTEILIQRGAQ